MKIMKENSIIIRTQVFKIHFCIVLGNLQVKDIFCNKICMYLHKVVNTDCAQNYAQLSLWASFRSSLYQRYLYGSLDKLQKWNNFGSAIGKNLFWKVVKRRTINWFYVQCLKHEKCPINILFSFFGTLRTNLNRKMNLN